MQGGVGYGNARAFTVIDQDQRNQCGIESTNVLAIETCHGK